MFDIIHGFGDSLQISNPTLKINFCKTDLLFEA